MKLYPKLSMATGLLLFAFQALAQYPEKIERIASSPYPVYAPDFRYEISVSDGLMTGRELVNDLGNDHDVDLTLLSKTQNIFVTARYLFNDKYSLGLTFGRQALSYHYRNEYAHSYYDYQQSITTLAVEFRGVMGALDWVEAYYVFGVGVSYSTEDDQLPSDPFYITQKIDPTRGYGLNLQIVGLGLRFGSADRVGGFVEFGIGYKGLVNGGLSYRFSNREIR